MVTVYNDSKITHLQLTDLYAFDVVKGAQDVQAFFDKYGLLYETS